MEYSDQNYVLNLTQAWKGELAFPQLLEFTAGLDAQNRRPLTIILYQTWLKRTTSPYIHAVWFNLGAALSTENDLDGAVDAYLKAIALSPTFTQPRINLGLLYERQGQLDKALEQWRWIVDNIVVAPENRAMVILALNHLGRVLENNKQMKDALHYLTRSLELDPDQPDALHHWVYLRQKQCAWPVYCNVDGVTVEAMQASTSALAMLSITDDPALQLAAAKRYVGKKLNLDVPALANPKGYGHARLRIAYLSSDFSLHPVSMLTAELYELHDRSHFEVYGFCWSPEDGSAMRKRVMEAMDHFIRINTLSDEAAAQLIRSHEIDILVDLQGQTAGARANILAYRPAPVQITYLGLPATTGFPFIDYVIADKFLIPEEYAQHYSEKPLYMPDVYQVSDRKRVIAPAPTRASCGLPEDGFVFCAFNNNYKITPQMFDVWMNILRRTPSSVLWTLADNPAAQENLIREAGLRGIAQERLIFAPRVAPENYLARYLVADVFLDTFPFNAGTTANDALWMGLPVVTLSGRAFAARMAGALLSAAGLGELIHYNFADYEEKAVFLANNPAECQRLRDRLNDVHDHGALFDTAKFVLNLEARFKQLVAALT